MSPAILIARRVTVLGALLFVSACSDDVLSPRSALFAKGGGRRPGAPAPTDTTTPPTDTTTTPPAPTVTTVSVTLGASSLLAGGTTTAQAVARDASGNVMSGQTVTWSTSSASIATVATDGTVTAVAAGTASISATIAGVTGSATLTVTAPAPLPPPPTGSTGLATAPTLPQATVDVSMPAQTGRIISVPAGASLQSAINSAVPGDVIELAPGATYSGNFILPAKTASSAWIVIRPAPGVALPAQGTRLDPVALGGQLPRIVSPNQAPAVDAMVGASGYRFVGVEITASTAITLNYAIVRFGDGKAAQMSEVPSRLVLDRVWVHGHATLQMNRCVQINSANSAVVDSYLSDCHGKNQESHGVSTWASPGPLRVENNYIEAAGIGMLVGGADPKISGLVPSDITVRRNHFYKPLAWKGVWTVKNGFELKNAKRVLLEANVLENTWVDGQNGFILLFQAMTQDNTAAWTTIQDVTVRYNVFKNAPNGVNILSRVAYPYGGLPALMPSQPSQRIELSHNVFDQIGSGTGGSGRFMQLLGDLQDVAVVHNTAESNNSMLYLDFGAVAGLQQRLTIQNNLVGRGSYGVTGNSVGEGTAALNKFAASWDFSGNVVYGTTAGGVNATLYPAGTTAKNTYPSSASSASIYASLTALSTLGTLSATKPLDAATTVLLGTDATAPGASLPTVRNAVAGVAR